MHPVVQGDIGQNINTVQKKSIGVLAIFFFFFFFFGGGMVLQPILSTLLII